MASAANYAAASDIVCRRCGLVATSGHATSVHCIAALRDLVADLEMRLESQHLPSPAGGKRDRKDNRFVILDGRRMLLLEAAQILGVHRVTLHRRLVAATGTSEYRDVDVRAVGADLSGSRRGRRAQGERA